jgi:hypothetical protein
MVALAVLGLASLAFAGDFHSGITLVCQDCHVMHGSQEHGYEADGTGNFTQPGGSAPYHYLLRNDVNELCLSCHNGQAWAPDVFEAHSNGYVRQAGALNEEGGNGLYPPATGHTLNSTDVAPGSNPAWSNPDGLNCANCHAVHGSGMGANWAGAGSFRNLGGFGTVPGSTFGITFTSGAANPNTAWVHEDANSGTNASHYGYDHVTFNERDQTTSQYASFCKSCHTDFHGAVGGSEIGGTGTPAEEFVRHPAAGVNIGAIGGGHSNLTRFVAEGANQLQVMSPTGKRHGSYDATDTELTPSCMTCHKAHGNQNAFGLIYMVGTGTVDEQGDDGADMRNTCRACHGQGGSNTNPW